LKIEIELSFEYGIMLELCWSYDKVVT